MPHTIWHDAPHEGSENFLPQRSDVRRRDRDGDLAILPEPTAECPHGLKYRLVYAVDGKRVVGYDNETGKGDHKHLGKRELPFQFADVETLVADFYTDIRSCK